MKKFLLLAVLTGMGCSGTPTPVLKQDICMNMMPIFIVATPKGPMPMKALPGCYCFYEYDNLSYFRVKPQEASVCIEEETKEDGNKKRPHQVLKETRPEFQDGAPVYTE